MFNFAYKDWTAVHKKIWADILLKNNLLEIRDKTVVEVGCFEGRSTVWFSDILMNTPNSKYICIDSWQDGKEFERLNLNYDMDLVFKNLMASWRRI